MGLASQRVHNHLTSASGVERLLHYMNCTDVDGKLLLQADLHLACFEGDHLLLMFLVCIPTILIVSLVLPVIQNYYLQENQTDCLKRDEALPITKSCGMLFLPFENHYYWWASAVLWRKVLFTFCLVVLQPFGQRVQSVTGFMVLSIAMVFHVRHKPFLHDDADSLESWSLALTQGDGLH